jgi:hypothetical protein
MGPLTAQFHRDIVSPHRNNGKYGQYSGPTLHSKEIRGLYKSLRSRGSSGSIVSDYGLDDRAIWVRSLAGAKDFSSSLCVQTSSEAHPASCITGYRGSFRRGKAWPGRDADHSPHLVPRSRKCRSYTSSPPKRHHGV